MSEFFLSHKRGIVEHGFNPRCLEYCFCIASILHDACGG